MAKILTADDKEINISKEYIPYLTTIKNMVDDLGNEDLIPLPILSEQWNTMETYLDIYINELPTDAENMLADKSNDELCDLLQTANHADFSALITSITDILALRIESLSPDEIRKIFMREYTPIEVSVQNEIKEKLKWYHEARTNGLQPVQTPIQTPTQTLSESETDVFVPEIIPENPFEYN